MTSPDLRSALIQLRDEMWRSATTVAREADEPATWAWRVYEWANQLDALLASDRSRSGETAKEKEP